MSIYISFAFFSLFASITPGPTNILAMTSGLHYGTQKTMPFVVSASFASSLMLFSISLGLTELFMTIPGLQRIISILGVIWISYMAWKLFNSGSVTNKNLSKQYNVGWYQGAILQFINPKTWLMTMTAGSLFPNASNNNSLHNLILASIFFIVTVPCIAGWAKAGASSAKRINNHSQQILLNKLLAVLLFLTVLVILIDVF